MRNLRPPSSRLHELAESKDYKKAFGELKKTILSRRLILKSGNAFDRYFYRLDLAYSKERNGTFFEPIPLSEVQKLLRRGNINESWVEIPDDYLTFKKKWEMRYFFDPSKPPSSKWNPFLTTPIVRNYQSGDYQEHKVRMEVDIRYPMRVLLRAFKDAIESHMKERGLTRRRKERYSDEEISRVRKLLQAGKTQEEIFNELCGQYEGFKPKMYAGKGVKADLNIYNARALLQRVGRIIKRERERKR